MNWQRVTMQFPCLVCEHPDWCTRSEIGSCCMRVSSPRPMKNGGWLHRLDAESKPPIHYTPAAPVPTIDATAILETWSYNTSPSQLDSFANELGVTSEALIRLGCCRSDSHRAWAFPMRDGASQIVGIRLRYDNGEKRAVRGSRSGLFIPVSPPQHTAWIAEGPTDCAAILSLGLFSIGRPSCSGGNVQLRMALKERRISKAVVIADNDPDKYRPDGERYNPGLDGAKRLAEELDCPTCILIPPTKDARQFVQCGGSADLLQSMLKSLIWNQPRPKTDSSINTNHGAFCTEPEFQSQDKIL